MTVTVSIMASDIVTKIDAVIAQMEHEQAVRLNKMAEEIYNHSYNMTDPGWFERRFRGVTPTKKFTVDVIRDGLVKNGAFWLDCHGGDFFDYEEWTAPSIPYYRSMIQLRDLVGKHLTRTFSVSGEVLQALEKHWDAYQERTHAAP